MKHVSKGVIVDPKSCVTQGQRISYIRLSVHPTNKPEAWSQVKLAELAGLSAETVNRVEANKVRLTKPVKHALCAALTIPVWLLDCPEDKWYRVVTTLGLEARLIVCGRKDLAKRAKKKSKG